MAVSANVDETFLRKRGECDDTSMGNLHGSGERSSGPLVELAPPIQRSRSFAEVVTVLHRLNALEGSIASAIATSRVPPSEVRLFLRAEAIAPAANAPAFQFMREIFAQVGLPLTVEAVGRFHLTLGVEDTPYARLFAGARPGKTCSFASEAISRFLATDLGLPAKVEEVACRNAEDPKCLFVASLDPMAVRVALLDAVDWTLLRKLGSGADLAESMMLSREEFKFRMERLAGYGLASAEGRRLPEGDEVLFAGPPSEDFEPPWRQVSELAEAIADAQSFAEAVVRVAPRESRTEPNADAETEALAAECRSFAELLARASRGRSSG